MDAIEHACHDREAFCSPSSQNIPGGFLRGEFDEEVASSWKQLRKRRLELSGATLSLFKMQGKGKSNVKPSSMLWCHDVRDIDFFLGAEANALILDLSPRRQQLISGKAAKQEKVTLLARSLSALATWMDAFVRVTSQSGISSFYKFTLRIGHGHRGSVALGWPHSSSLSTSPVAIKTIPTDLVTSSAVESSLATLCNQNSNILGIFDVFRTKRYVHVVSEYARGGSLESLLSRGIHLRTDVVRSIFAELLNALQHLHDKGGRVHGAVNARSILFLKARGVTDESGNTLDSSLSPGRGGTVLKAFGLSRRISHFNEAMLESYHLAPEVLCFDLFSGSSDIFSAGALLYRMLGDGTPPFGDATTEAAYLAAVSRGPDFTGDSWRAAGKNAVAFVTSLLSHAPYDRPSAGAALRSAWVRGDDSCEEMSPPSAAALAVRIARGGSVGIEEARGWKMEGEF